MGSDPCVEGSAQQPVRGEREEHKGSMLANVKRTGRGDDAGL